MTAKAWPEELTPELRQVLGLMLWETGPLAHLFRKADGREIPRRAEAEQAFILHWLIGLALEHGPEWRTVAAAEIGRLHQQLPPPTPPEAA